MARFDEAGKMSMSGHFPIKAASVSLALSVLLLASQGVCADELTDLWAGLERACFLEDLSQCQQVGDLDQDGLEDRVLTVNVRACGKSSCPKGIVVVSSAGHHLRIGAGKAVELASREFELDEQGALVWTALDAPETFSEDVDWLRYLWVGRSSKTTSKPLCARAMELNHDVMVLSSEDAAMVVVFHEGAWTWVDCGY